jgi:hypothetical protein
MNDRIISHLTTIDHYTGISFDLNITLLIYFN